MKATIQGDTLQIRLIELIEAIDPEQLRLFADSLACSDDVIRYVTQQILDKWTEHTSHGMTNYTARAEPTTGLDWAWREVAKRSSEVAAREIERLEDALSKANERIEQFEKQQRDREMQRLY